MQKRLQQAGVACTVHQPPQSSGQDGQTSNPLAAAEEVAVVDRLVAESLQHGLLCVQEAPNALQHDAAADTLATARPAQQSEHDVPDSSVSGAVEEGASPDSLTEKTRTAAVVRQQKSGLRRYTAGKLSRHGVLVDLARSKLTQQGTT